MATVDSSEQAGKQVAESRGNRWRMAGGIARLSHKNPDGNCSKIRAPKILAWHPMANKARYSGEQIDGFIGMFKNDISDLWDNRGKRHSLALVIAGFVMATLMGRQKFSCIHRYIVNRADWLGKLTQTEVVKPISLAHLPRLLD